MANENIVTKSDLIAQIAEVSKTTKVAAKNQLDTIFDLIGDALNEGKDVTIGGFGNFRIRQTAERVGRNPKTGEAINIPAGTKVVFRRSKVSA